MRNKTQAMSTLFCILAPTFAPDVVLLGVLALFEAEAPPFNPPVIELVEDGGAAAARLPTDAHLAAAFVLVLPSR
jgi:hypothetical protein